MLENNIYLLDNKITTKLYNDLIIQLNKDLLLSGIDFKLQLNCKPKSLVNDLTKLFHTIILKERQKFSQFMYVLDIPENKLASINETNLEAIINRIVRLVLERILQKVYLKQKFGSL